MTDLGGGLGLERGVLRLHAPLDGWMTIGRDLASGVARALNPLAIEVQHVGSTAVPGLVAKPIIDLAIGIASMDDFSQIAPELGEMHWVYDGDAGDDGGHLFLLEREPDVRVAHAHVVVHDGFQWKRYLRFRDHLRISAVARESYATAKLALLDELGVQDVRPTYTERKSPIIAALLDAATES